MWTSAVVSQTPRPWLRYLFFHVQFDASASESNVNALCGGGKKDLHTILILHGNSLSPHGSGQSGAIRVIVLRRR